MLSPSFGKTGAKQLKLKMETGQLERKPLQTQNMNVVQTLNSDSDSSDGDSPPKIRKTRSTRTAQNVTKTVSDTTEKPTILKKQVSVYSTRVSKCLDDFKSGRLQLCVEKDPDEILGKSPPHPVPVTDLPKTTLNDSQDSQGLNSSTITSPESSFVRSRSPTPPPTPGVLSPPKRRTRCTKRIKNVQKALRALEDMKDRYETPVNVGDDEDDDDDELVLISHIASPVIEKKDMCVMVRYKEKIYKYTMAMGDPFQSVKTRLSADINEDKDCLFFMLRERNIQPSETPKSIGLHIADILDCHVYKAAEDGEEDIPARDAISLYVQCQNRRNKIQFKVHKFRPLRTLMESYAKTVKTELSYLKFMFDGEDILPSDTADGFDMEDNDTIDAVEV